MLKSDLCDYSDAYIFVKGTIDILVADTNKNDKAQKSVASKNNTPFRSCISKIKSSLIEKRNLDIAMSVYNRLEYGKNYSMT